VPGKHILKTYHKKQIKGCMVQPFFLYCTQQLGKRKSNMSQELNQVVTELNRERKFEGHAPVDAASRERWVVLDYIYDQLASETLYGPRTARQAQKRKRELESAKSQLLEQA
jgi:hypothetical protein